MKRLALVLALAALACHKAPAPADKPQSPEASNGLALTGTVREAITSAGYTYLRVHTAAGDFWAAVPQIEVKPGATVTVDEQMVQDHFQSKSLNRTFERLVFGTLEGQQETLPPPPPSAPAPATAPASEDLTGTVAEAINAAGYSYLRVRTATGEIWAAVPETNVKVGEKVTIAEQMVQENFPSKTLHRTFPRLVFGTLAGAGATAAMPLPPGHPALNEPPGKATDLKAAEHMRSGEASLDTKIAPASGSDAKTVAEIWASRTALKDRQVSVRGKVVKFLPQILGKNWVHLRDGTGSVAGGDDELTVTTNDTAAVGDVVTAHGTVHVDKDFGAGYRYGAVLEDATLSK